ncbi:MAG: HepT-like ribonuclease domain-containing protein [Chitinophagaceae bacterium]
MRNRLGDKERLEHMLDAVELILRHTEGMSFAEFEQNEMLPFAVVKNLEIIGEAANHLSEDTKQTEVQIDWSKIISARHIFVHAYYDTDWEIVWTIASDYLAPLKEALMKMIEKEKDNDATNK